MNEPGGALRVLIVDDEEPARQFLRRELETVGSVEILGECANGFAAVKAATELKPEVVFLDIQMPKLDGFEVCELLDPKVLVVFVTAYDAHALRAFEVHAVDYLLKPVSAERLRRALEHARERLGEPGPGILAVSAAARPAGFLERLVVKDGADIVFIPCARLDWVEAQEDFVALHSQGRSFLKNQTIASLEAALDPKRFVRIHRSSIVNLERIVQVHPYSKDDKLAVLKDGTRLPISRGGYKKLRALWDGAAP
jgi:two-component system LytT family response regulator